MDTYGLGLKATFEFASKVNGGVDDLVWYKFAWLCNNAETGVHGCHSTCNRLRMRTGFGQTVGMCCVTIAFRWSFLYLSYINYFNNLT